MRNRYKLKIDGEIAYEGNHIPSLKKNADFELEYLYKSYAEILVGKKVYAYRFHDGGWTR